MDVFVCNYAYFVDIATHSRTKTAAYLDNKIKNEVTIFWLLLKTST